ncbi:MAG: glutamine-hydrolyzing GMP synthase [Leptospiraceae bacterium]|nr:glutamine-hydrolyzing GMP synthase [Leptospiraceae bacterium]
MQKIIVLDFGSQYTQLIARKIRELRHYAEIHPYNFPYKKLLAEKPAGIILSGGPHSVYEKKAPTVVKELFASGIPVLGICYGLQLTAHLLGGKVIASEHREYGKAALHLKKKSPLLLNVPDDQTVWMSHGDKVDKIPPGFEAVATSLSSPNCVIQNSEKNWYGVQFHPEVQHSKYGKLILKNFCEEICQMKPSWSMKNFAKSKIQEIRELVGDHRVLLGTSGGVDSTVTAKLLHDAIGDQLSCVYIDNGVMRLNETAAVKERFIRTMGIPLHIVDASRRFLKELHTVTEPEQKRKIIGRLFIEEFQRKAKEIGHHEFLAQGTLYTDVIESVSVKGPSQTIKSHHNRVAEVLKMLEAGKVIEPLKELFKDEVRRLGLALKIPREALFRHPFPGPGLAIRVLGELSAERLNLLRKADAILIDELKSTGYYAKVWQAFAVFLPVQSVGVMGDQRTYENVIALRMVSSEDGMTADFAKLPHEFLGRVSSRIINEVKGINRVVYDISSKPPATIEWE